MSLPLQTPRLTLRPFQSGDLRTFLAYRNDPQVARYQSWETIREEWARVFIADCARSEPGRPGEWYQVAITLRKTGELIGDMGLGTDGDDPTQGEVGFTLAQEHWGKGYASEAVSALLDYAFSTLNMSRIRANCDTRNEASARLMERVGMKRVSHSHNVFFKGEYCNEYHYAIEREEWARLRNALET